MLKKNGKQVIMGKTNLNLIFPPPDKDITYLCTKIQIEEGFDFRMMK